MVADSSKINPIAYREARATSAVSARALVMTMASPEDVSQARTQGDLKIEKLRLKIKALEARILHQQEKRDKQRRAADELPDPEKEKLESEKLAEEIKELRTRTRFIWLPSAISIATILAALVTAWITASSYFNQQERNGELQLTDPLIRVAQQLSSDEEFDRQTATLLLSALEKNAVPVLLLTLAKHPQDSTYAIEALSLIETNPHVCAQEDVVGPLLNRATEEFQGSPLNDPPHAHAILSFTEAVGRLAIPTPWRLHCFRWPWQALEADRALPALVALRSRIESAKEQGKLDEAGHFALGTAIDLACKRLSNGKPCPPV
jgi:hypothetical protein